MAQEFLSTTDISVTALWSIWNNRNHAVFQGNTNPILADDPIVWASNYIIEYVEAQSGSCSGQTRTLTMSNDGNGSPISWFPPPINQYKLNVDATLKNGDMGFGIIIRDSKGETMMTAERFRRTCVFSRMGRGSSTFRWSQVSDGNGNHSSLGKDRLKDCLESLQDEDKHFNETAPLIENLKQLFQDHPIRGFLLVPRDGNKICSFVSHTCAYLKAL